MGFGQLSSNFSFIPRDVPGKPSTAPRNVKQSKNRYVLYIEYDTVIEDGGSPRLNYNIYIDDGLDGAFSGPILNSPSLLTWNS